MLRVGRIKYNPQIVYPSYDGFTRIVIMMKSHSKYFDLSPYYLENEKGQIMENIWQFSKCYKEVSSSIQYYSRFNHTIIWQHPAETHIDENDNITEKYKNWREKGMNNKYAVRYPVGYKHRSKCLYSLKELSGPKLDYIEARKEIYVKEYCRLVKKEKSYQLLQEMLKKGKNLLIVEVDGPHEESLDYYKENYGVNNSFIQRDTMLFNEENNRIMLNDPKHSYGHGYALCLALLDKEEEWI